MKSEEKRGGAKEGEEEGEKESDELIHLQLMRCCFFILWREVIKGEILFKKEEGVMGEIRQKMGEKE